MAVRRSYPSPNPRSATWPIIRPPATCLIHKHHSRHRYPRYHYRPRVLASGSIEYPGHNPSRSGWRGTLIWILDLGANDDTISIANTLYNTLLLVFLSNAWPRHGILDLLYFSALVMPQPFL